MYVLLFDVFKHLLLRKTDVLKTCRESKFLGKKIWRNALGLKSKKVQGIFTKIFVSALSSSTVFRLQKPCLRFLLNCFAGEIGEKGFYRSSLGNEVDFRDIMNVSPIILAKNSIFKKLRHGFVDERALITTTLISSCHWKTLALFCLRKKRPENALLTLIVNYFKIVQKSKLCYSKQQ